MVIIHRGRKTGQQHQTPVNFARVAGDLFCTAAYGARADWYLNILEYPQVEIWSPDGWWEGVAEDVTEAENAAEILRKVLIGSGFAARFFGLNPYKLSENELEGLLCKYRLICIQLTRARTGSGGPGDLAWIWPIVTFLLLLIFLYPRKAKRHNHE